ncbi:hypothetical protein ACH50O_20245 [Methylomonas sp. 2BW1-5-20]|uniref:hypothetical protein n=1 Tax=Methylomonas sp. 2BW1-5-20 TaxID=3376686 RepID=UPI00404C2B78
MSRSWCLSKYPPTALKNYPDGALCSGCANLDLLQVGVVRSINFNQILIFRWNLSKNQFTIAKKAKYV